MRDGRNIVLFGFMGTGKTAVARVLGKKLGRPVVEMDELIEEREGMAISRIFAERGERYFRRVERNLARELSGGRGRIIATGGGVVLDHDNIRDLARSGLSVCLTARPEAILSRVAGESHRPLLERPDREKTVKRMLKERRPHYERIPHQVDTSDLSVEEVADRVIGLMGNRE